MAIRDVNNYTAVTTSGKAKQKGAYAWKAHRHGAGVDVQWHQNHSALIVPMAAEASIVYGVDVETFIRCHTEPLDFCIHAKAPRSNTIVSIRDGVETELQNINRYYVTHDGVELVKIAPPAKGARIGTWKRRNGVSDVEYDAVIAEVTSPNRPYLSQAWTDSLDIDGVPHDARIHTKAKSKHTERRTGFAKDWKVTVCNTMTDFDISTINYDYYIAEARKLVDPLL